MRRFAMIAVLAAATLLSSHVALAQDDASQDRYALGVGVGLVKPSGDTETYFMAALRIRLSGRDQGDHRRAQGISGYIEPEVGYWKSTDSRISGSDFLVGANLIGVVPFGNVDSFFGVGAGLHSIDAQVLRNDPLESGSETKLGLNAQFGIDIFVNHSVSVFGASRFDLVQDASDNIQSKLYLGVRGRF